MAVLPPHPPSMPHSPFHGTSEMARRMRALDWSQTALGPVDRWPDSLRASVSTCLECAFPIALWWGPSLSLLYNDEYISLLGPAKHPWALGRPGAEVWPEIWDVIDPMLSQVLTRGEPTRSRDLLLHVDRGYPEEAYFSFSFSPIHAEDGGVDGVFCPVIETTDKVIGARRLQTLRDLAAATKGAEREDAACEAAAVTLASNPHDVPFALIYRVNAADGLAERVALAGLAPRTRASPDSIPLDGRDDCWAIADVAASGRTAVLTDLRTRFDTLPSGAWKSAPHTALVQPVVLPGHDRPHAVLVTAANPMRAVDTGYRTFFELVGAQIAAGVADVRALEQERRRGESLAELDHLRRDTERILRNRMDQFETLFRRAPIGVYLVAADFTILEVNPVAEPLFGDVPGGVVGRPLDEVLHRLWNQQYADEIVAIFRRTLATGEPYVSAERAEFRIDRGAVEYYDWRVDRITLPDGRYGLVCYFRDISPQVRARLTIAESERQLREADTRKDEFLALLAHELRNPLAPIRTGLELIRLSGDAPETVRRVRTMIERQVTLMVRLIDDLLDVSRITSGKIVLQRRPTALAELVHSAVESQRAAIEAGDITLTVDLPAQACVLDVDPARFVQIVSNILHNASKFTPPGGRITLKVDVESGTGGSTAAIRIADTGVGMPTALLGRIFELFTQGDVAAERAQGGLGLGLALARRLTEMHDGEITAYSEGPGRGSEFVVRFPLSKAAAETDSPPTIAAPRVRSRALIIDDNRDAATTMSMFVEELGGLAVTAHDGASGLAALESFRPDIVFMDIGMPGLDGYEVCRRIRAMPSHQGVVLVAVTGWGQAQDKRRALEVGFDAHLTKPVDPDAVAQLLAGAAV